MKEKTPLRKITQKCIQLEREVGMMIQAEKVLIKEKKVLEKKMSSKQQSTRYYMKQSQRFKEGLETQTHLYNNAMSGLDKELRKNKELNKIRKACKYIILFLLGCLILSIFLQSCSL